MSSETTDILTIRQVPPPVLPLALPDPHCLFRRIRTVRPECPSSAGADFGGDAVWLCGGTAEGAGAGFYAG